MLAHVIAHGLLGYDRALVASAVSEADAGAADPNRRVIAVAEAAGRVLKQRKAPPAEVEAADRMSVELIGARGLRPARGGPRVASAGGDRRPAGRALSGHGGPPRGARGRRDGDGAAVRGHARQGRLAGARAARPSGARAGPASASWGTLRNLTARASLA